ncbi:MAG: hypothetical protein J4F39_18950 [Candidatus Latescibacteria bacterium]|nr:hypothetical protein [Candidatus Latescibacterota bacterium]
MQSHLALLHTTPVLIDAFDRLIEEADLEFRVKHIVEEEFLTEAREKGISQDLDGRIRGRIGAAIEEGAAVVLCTCSTIGASAESANDAADGVVIRVDRPMAEKAVETGSRIIVAAALESTLAPTRNLILEVASTRKKRIDLIEVLCDNAWSRLEDGDNEGYLSEIARTLRERASEGDVIVLAQASMAGAADLCPEISIPILSSPEIGFQYAVDIWKEKGGC